MSGKQEREPVRSPTVHAYVLPAAPPGLLSRIEQLIFGRRLVILLLTALLLLGLGAAATQIRIGADFERMLPGAHPYIQTWKATRQALGGLGNAVRISVRNPAGDIYAAPFLAQVRAISDEVFLLPGVDRAHMRSIWTPNVRWTAVTESGLDGGPVIPNDYAETAAGVDSVRANVANSNEIGHTVSLDQHATLIYAPLTATVDYKAFAEALEDLRTRYEARGVEIQITGFAKVVGDLIAGMRAVVMYFGVSALACLGILYLYTRCARSASIVLLCSLTAVVMQLGLMALMGVKLDPYLLLVPFLVFAIGMSHGAQKLNGILQDVARGADKLSAARLTFRRLFVAGLVALVCDIVGFAVLAVIDIAAIRELALVSCIGVLLLVFTNLILLPILLSLIGVGEKGAERALVQGGAFERLTVLTRRGPAIAVVLAFAVLTAAGYLVSRQLQIGDLDAGAPELKPDSRYNRDARAMGADFGASSDVFVVVARTAAGACTGYDNLSKVDRLEWQLRQLPEVEATLSLASLNRAVVVGLNEGNPKWTELLRNQDMINTITGSAPRGLYNDACDTMPIMAFLRDHKAATLERVVHTVEQFAQSERGDAIRFELAAGNAGIDAATNQVVAKANQQMLFMVYAAVALLCMATFRSWRATLCTLIPLGVTSILCEALMVALNIGVKVATLPVVALGVGIGVDYALYMVSVVLTRQRAGDSLAEAYRKSLMFTGRVVFFTGATLGVAVLVWAWSPIKFQADMGLLLGFMFIGNMLGAIVLIPALAHFLMPGPSHTTLQENRS